MEERPSFGRSLPLLFAINEECVGKMDDNFPLHFRRSNTCIGIVLPAMVNFSTANSNNQQMQWLVRDKRRVFLHCIYQIGTVAVEPSTPSPGTISLHVLRNLYIYNLIKMYNIHIDCLYGLWEHGCAGKNTIRREYRRGKISKCY